MTDQYLAPPMPQPEFGPTPEDIAAYSAILQRVEEVGPYTLIHDKRDPAGLGFNLRTCAEMTSFWIDRGAVQTATNPDVGTVGLNQKSKLELGQERYIAGVLGLNVGETVIHAKSYIANAKVSLPTLADLPPLPTNKDGKFFDEQGIEISQVRADAITAGHFIANNADHFSQHGAFENLFKRVVEQAETGQILVRDKAGDPKGAMSLVRQVARVLGYEVNSFQRGDEEGAYTMPVTGIRKGFDTNFTYFKK